MSCKISISILEILKYWNSCWKLIIVAIIILLYSLIWFIFEVLTEVKEPSLFRYPAQGYVILTCTWIFWIFTFGRKFFRIFWTTGYFLMICSPATKISISIYNKYILYEYKKGLRSGRYTVVYGVYTNFSIFSVMRIKLFLLDTRVYAYDRRIYTHYFHQLLLFTVYIL